MLLYRAKPEQDIEMAKKNKRKKRSARSLTAAVKRSPEQMVQLAENALAQGQLRKACTLFRQLCQDDPDRYLGRWVDASQRLFDQLMADGCLVEAKALLVSLERKVGADAIRSSLMHLALHQGDFVRAASLAAAEIAEGAALTDPQLARAVDALVLDFQEGDPEPVLPPQLAADRQRVWQALGLVSRGDFDAALQAVRPVGLGSPFADWKWFIKGLCAFHTGQDPKARQAFARLAAGSLPAKAADAYLLLLGEGPGEGPNPKNPAVLQAACLLAGVGEAGPVIARADALWQTGRYRDALRHVQRHLSDFPSDRPGFQHDLTQFFYNGWSDLPERQADAYIDFLCRSAEKRRQVGALEKLLACKAEALWLERNWCEDRDLAQAWEYVLASYQARHGHQPQVAAIVYQHLGDLFTQEVEEETPFDFFFLSRRSKSTRLRNPRLAAQFYQQALNADADNPEGYFALLGLYEKTAEKSKVNRTLDDIIRRFPDNKTALLKAGMRCLERNAFNKGMGYLERALALDPIDAQAREGFVIACIQAGLRYAQKDRMAQCREVMQRALERASKRTDDFNLGRCYLHVRWAVMAEIGGDPAEAARQMAAAAALNADDFRLDYFALLMGVLYGQPPEGHEERQRRVIGAIERGLTVEKVLSMVAVLEYFRRLPPKRRKWLPAEETLFGRLLAMAARLEWLPEQARPVVAFVLSAEKPHLPWVEPLVKAVLGRHPDDPWFRWFRFVLDYGTHPGLSHANPRVGKDLQVVRALAEKAGDTELIAQIRKVEKIIEEARRIFESFGKDFPGLDITDDDEDDDYEDEEDEAEPPPRRKLPPPPRQLDLF
jgi:tetratricopeptide (TPR) repeat protein